MKLVQGLNAWMASVVTNVKNICLHQIPGPRFSMSLKKNLYFSLLRVATELCRNEKIVWPFAIYYYSFVEYDCIFEDYKSKFVFEGRHYIIYCALKGSGSNFVCKGQLFKSERQL